MGPSKGARWARHKTGGNGRGHKQSWRASSGRPTRRRSFLRVWTRSLRILVCERSSGRSSLRSQAGSRNTDRNQGAANEDAHSTHRRHFRMGLPRRRVLSRCHLPPRRPPPRGIRRALLRCVDDARRSPRARRVALALTRSGRSSRRSRRTVASEGRSTSPVGCSTSCSTSSRTRRHPNSLTEAAIKRQNAAADLAEIAKFGRREAEAGRRQRDVWARVDTQAHAAARPGARGAAHRRGGEDTQQRCPLCVGHGYVPPNIGIAFEAWCARLHAEQEDEPAAGIQRSAGEISAARHRRSWRITACAPATTAGARDARNGSRVTATRCGGASDPRTRRQRRTGAATLL